MDGECHKSVGGRERMNDFWTLEFVDIFTVAVFEAPGGGFSRRRETQAGLYVRERVFDVEVERLR